MNKFKLLVSNSLEQKRKNDISNENKQQKREEIQMLSLLDKCTQILRDDRVWIHNKVKQTDANILSIFRKHKKPLNLQQLQIELRKYVNKVKQQYKMEQLNKFKQNMCNSNTYIIEKSNKPSSKGKKNESQPNLPYNSNNNSLYTNKNPAYYNSNQPNYHRDNLNHKQEAIINEQKYKNKKLFEKFNFPQTIKQDELEETEKSSHRQDQKRKNNHHMNNSANKDSNISNTRFGFFNQNAEKKNDWMLNNNNHKNQEQYQQQSENRQSFNLPQQEYHERSIQQQIKNRKLLDLLPEKRKFAVANNFQNVSLKNSEEKDNSYNHEEEFHRLQHFQHQDLLHQQDHQTEQINSHEIPAIQVIQSKNQENNSSKSYEYESPNIKINESSGNHKNNVEDHNKPIFDLSSVGFQDYHYDNASIPISNKFLNLDSFLAKNDATTFQNSSNPLMNQFPMSNNYLNNNDNNIFTSPALLEQCRKTLKEHSSKKKSGIFNQEGSQHNLDSREKSNKFPEQNTFSFKPSSLFNNELYSKDILNMNNINNGLNPLEQTRKIYGNQIKQSQPTKLQQLVSKTFLYSQTKNVESNTKSKKKQEIQRYNYNINRIEDLYAQDIFQIIFPEQSNYIISIEEYEKIIVEHFQHYNNYSKLFFMDSRPKSTKVSIIEIGDILESVCDIKPHNNIRQIHSLIDTMKNGYFTYDDYLRFLNQIMEQQNETFEQIQEIIEKLFQLADITQQRRVYYWSLYFIKQSIEFQQFSNYLNQYEFEIKSQKQNDNENQNQN